MSTTTLINQTGELVRLAIFKQPVLNPNLATIAWGIAEPPPGGQQVIEIPDGFSVFAQYSDNSDPPTDLSPRSNIVSFAETTAVLVIESPGAQDGRAPAGAHIRQQFTDLVPNEVRVQNLYGAGCLTTIAKGGDAIYLPQVIWPGGLFLEDVRSSLYVAVVPPFTYKGSRLVQEEISITQAEVLGGAVLVVTGTQWNGYSIATR